jgi:serine/threonine protein kinase
VSDDALSRVGTHLTENLKLVGVLGEGGMGVVYRAEERMDVLGDKPPLTRAVKLLRRDRTEEPEFTRRFKREAEMTLGLDHPRIIRLFTADFTPEGELYLVMQLLEGMSLSEKLEREGRLEVGLAVKLSMQLCEALAHAHEKGVIHRDLKPMNLFVRRDLPDSLTVLDFGIAKHMHAEAAHTQMTMPGMIVGTRDYLSRERAQGDCPGCVSCDLYSVGLILGEMLAGRGDPVTLLDRLRGQDGIPFELVELVRDCCREHADRPPSARVLLDRLERVELGSSTRTTQPIPRDRPAGSTTSLDRPRRIEEGAGSSEVPTGAATIASADPETLAEPTLDHARVAAFGEPGFFERFPSLLRLQWRGALGVLSVALLLGPTLFWFDKDAELVEERKISAAALEISAAALESSAAALERMESEKRADQDKFDDLLVRKAFEIFLLNRSRPRLSDEWEVRAPRRVWEASAKQETVPSPVDASVSARVEGIPVETESSSEERMSDDEAWDNGRYLRSERKARRAENKGHLTFARSKRREMLSRWPERREALEPIIRDLERRIAVRALEEGRTALAGRWWELALVKFRKAKEEFPEDTTIDDGIQKAHREMSGLRVEEGKEQYKDENFAIAVAKAKQALKHNPANQDAKQLLTWALNKLPSKEALANKRVLARNLTEQGVAARRDARSEEAIKLFDKAVVEDPMYANARLELGKSHAENGDSYNARVNYEVFLRLAPDDPLAEKIRERVQELLESQRNAQASTQ